MRKRREGAPGSAALQRGIKPCVICAIATLSTVSGCSIEDHFGDVTEMIEIGKGGVIISSSRANTVPNRLRRWSKNLKTETLVLWFAVKHKETPRTAKILAAFVLAYAFSPIDLIPDFIPVLGLLDDALLLPIGILIVRRMIPDHVMDESRKQAEQFVACHQGRPVSAAGAILVVMIWLGVLILMYVFGGAIIRLFQNLSKGWA